MPALHKMNDECLTFEVTIPIADRIDPARLDQKRCSGFNMCCSQPSNDVLPRILLEERSRCFSRQPYISLMAKH